MPTAPRGDEHWGCTLKLTALQRSERIHPIIHKNLKRLPIHEPMQLNSVVRACQHSHTYLHLTLAGKRKRRQNGPVFSTGQELELAPREGGCGLSVHTTPPRFHTGFPTQGQGPQSIQWFGVVCKVRTG